MSELEQSLRQWVEAHTKPGERLDITSTGLMLEVRVRCSGRISWLACYCSQEPGHSGECYSSDKHLTFTPEEKP